MKNSTMTQEEKDLLLKDLCARLPYGVKCKYYDCCEGDYEEGTICGFEREEYIQIDGVCIRIEEVKPYLFPLSSMTEEQKYICPIGVGNLETFIEKESWAYLELSFDSILRFIDWLNKNHFDYRGLIEKSLALDATNLGIYE